MAARSLILDDTIIEEIRTLAKSGASIDDIARQIKVKIMISSDRIKYIVSV